ncbi:MAG: hypothetical protein BM564_01060 [Bacteroidetes bacterium MedPE-SWsnd-G2]|nr:MAG: hypothetical protein BM564_01060 [Bacteroidetes bacterium MedPE-SWsnd-G2]
MKKLVLALIVAISFSSISNAQSFVEEVDFFQSVFGMEKKAIIQNYLNVDTNSEFWDIYNDYEAQRKELGQERLELLVNYANTLASYNDDKADFLIKHNNKLSKKLDKLIYKYYKRVKRTNGSKLASQFYQAEHFFLGEIRSAAFSTLPIIGEFN